MTEAVKTDTTRARLAAPSRRAALLGALGVAVAPVAGAEGAAHPDAEIIRLCAEHIANFDAYNNDTSDLDAEDNPLWPAYERTRKAINQARPRTLAGMQAKARAAKREACTPDGGEEPDGTPAASWAWDLVNDLLALHPSQRMV